MNKETLKIIKEEAQALATERAEEQTENWYSGDDVSFTEPVLVRFSPEEQRKIAEKAADGLDVDTNGTAFVEMSETVENQDEVLAFAAKVGQEIADEIERQA